MHHQRKYFVTAACFDWNDLGPWDALEEVLEKKNENTSIGEKMLYTQNAKGNIVFAPNKFVSLRNADLSPKSIGMK